MRLTKQPYGVRALPENESFDLFESAESAWFWFLAAQKAKDEGARFTAGLSQNPRPCEPIDVLKVVDRLYRHRRLLMDHIMVLRHYGRRGSPPDYRRPKEARASRLWKEAMDRIELILIEKNIVAARPPRNSNWVDEFELYQAAE